MAKEIEVEESGEKEKKPSKSPMKLIIIGVAVLVVLIGGIIGFLLIGKGSDEKAGDDASALGEMAKIDDENAVGLIFPLETFVVNLNDTGGKRYLKTRLELEYIRMEAKEELTARMPQMRDVVLLSLSSKTMEEIQGIEGKIALRNELILRINQILKKWKIRNLYFTEFVIQ